MRILIVNKFLYPNGGSETYIFKIGSQLQKMGHAVQYFGMDHKELLEIMRRVIHKIWIFIQEE